MADRKITLPEIKYMQPLPDKYEREQMANDICRIFGIERTVIQDERGQSSP